MENAPLTLAYKHARNAAQETKRSNPVAASEEHDLAAAEFAAATAGTTDHEALRILKLLEQHHKHLALILKDTQSRPSGKREVSRQESVHTDSADGPPHVASTPPRLTRTGRSSARELSNSIASHYQSARGIPNTKQKRTVPVSPLVSNEHADGAFTQDATEHIRGARATSAQQSARPSWAPPEPVLSRTATSDSASDSPFQQFYSRFENAISSLTAPLAFASLPLAQPAAPQKEPQKAVPSEPSPRKVSSKAAPSPAALDYSQLISNAALRAVRDSDLSSYSRPHESFLLVPTSGGTLSYADITAANYVDRQVNRHRRDHSNTSNDDFVDASSQVLSPTHPPRPGSIAASTANQQKYNGETPEEMQLQNTVLKKTVNVLTKRLHAFELTAQDARLAQSMRSLQLSPITTPENSRGKMILNSAGSGGGNTNDAGLRMAQQRILELEEALQKTERKLFKTKEENAKSRETLVRYKEKWDGLKAGAKARREQAGGGDKLKRGISTATTATMGTVTSSSPSKDREVVQESGKA